jgi:hypothetical protein
MSFHVAHVITEITFHIENKRKVFLTCGPEFLSNESGKT